MKRLDALKEAIVASIRDITKLRGDVELAAAEGQPVKHAQAKAAVGAAKQAKGAVKEAVGKATDNKKTEAEGKMDKAVAVTREDFAAIRTAIAGKPKGHDFEIARRKPAVARHMSTTGG